MSEILAKVRGEIPFPEAGEGVIIRFTNNDIVELQTLLGDDIIQNAAIRAANFDIRFIAECAKRGVIKKGMVVPQKDYDHVPLEDLGAKIVDGLWVAAFGRTYEDQIRWATIERARRDADESPPESPAT